MRVNVKKQRYLLFFGPFPLRGRGMSVYPSGRVVRDVSILSPGEIVARDVVCKFHSLIHDVIWN